ncbi:hypothetical protein SAMN06265365_11476 [Tistlia consotensis]|uniref:Uncharacterized protein n=1 Tax=Tistlia consotensis USBA 355 TaxID=560819 RepID=A0A1Y6BE86_9PROT|nr:hypothetical protein [Tistlia consotensis]SME99476.1 hypothetical protein SAMN05428998_102287 [Tistlia consotensis USBA 355]SNR76750.1 hypothetical protein SAMN06265365_11476 [Tistlia consotensis]
MSVTEILTEEFLAELPDDSRAAFGMVLRRADTYLAEALQAVDETENSSWYVYETAQHTAMNTIIAVAKRYAIRPFADMAVPPRRGFGAQDFAEFKVDLDHYTAQLLLDNSIRSKRDAVVIEPKVKDRLRQHVYGIKTLIDQTEMPEPRRAVLHKRIADFEAALERPRVNVVMLAGVIVTILAGAANVAQLADSPAMQKLVANIMTTIGEAKAIDEEKRELPPVQPPQPLLPPRPADAKPPKERDGAFAADLDDDIPF